MEFILQQALCFVARLSSLMLYFPTSKRRYCADIVCHSRSWCGKCVTVEGAYGVDLDDYFECSRGGNAIYFACGEWRAVHRGGILYGASYGNTADAGTLCAIVSTF